MDKDNTIELDRIGHIYEEKISRHLYEMVRGVKGGVKMYQWGGVKVYRLCS